MKRWILTIVFIFSLALGNILLTQIPSNTNESKDIKITLADTRQGRWMFDSYVFCGLGRGGCQTCRCVKGGYSCSVGEWWNCCVQGDC